LNAWLTFTVKEITMTQNFENRIALVTGAARGIGQATALMLHARGARVVATDIGETVHALACDGIVTMTGNIAEEETARRSVALAMETFGGLDILVNNAGRTMNRPLIDMTVEDWDGVMAVNARGTFLHARETVRAMIARDGGVIVNVASIVAQVAMKDTAVYAASKGAIAQLTKVIAVEYGDRGIRANAVAPGVVETDILEGIVPDSRATLASYGSAHPLGRVGQPEDIAEVIAFLASPASAFMTGTMVTADGGFTAL
jgi:NAD(P)-dependent dehydrogenase (short-subunit alcohol dehydrogenase family)